MSTLYKEYMNRVFRFAPHMIIVLFLLTLPGFADLAIVSLVTRIFIFGLLVMALDLVFGYTGLMSLGHAAFFGVAGYTTAILIKYYHVTSFWLAAPAGVLMATLVAAVFGIVALRAKDVYFFLVTMALGQLVFEIFNTSTSAGKLRAMTGGSDGLGGIPYPDLGFSFSPTSYYYFALIAVAICAFLLYLITKSPFGYSIQGIRESETRMRCLGYNIWLHKYFAFIIAGLFAGVAGVLFIYFNGFISPESVGFNTGGLILLMLILGGKGTLWGAVIGTGVMLALQYFVGTITPQRWPLIMGGTMVGVIMFFRGGIFPLSRSLWERVRR
jgi:branched-chain amino acid transport system permease protein